MEDSINKDVVINSFGWKLLERFCSQGINLLVQILLARLLLPKDFGSLAIMTAIISYASLFVQSGLATAIVQKKNLDNKDVNTLFTASLFVALLMYIGIFVGSFYVADLYKMPELIWPLRVLSLVLFLNAINSVQAALLSRNMQFKQIFYRSVIAVPLAGVISVSMAYLGFGLWALVAHSLFTMGLTVVVMALASDYKLRFGFSWERAKVLYSFSIKILLSTLVSGGGDTLRTLIIGKKYNATDLAYYDKAYTYSSYFTQIINASTTSVLLPTFSRKQDDLIHLRQMARRSVQMTAYVVIPMLTLIICVADPFVNLFLTEKWASSVPFLMLFCVLRMPGSISLVDKQVYFAMGNGTISLVYEICLLIANVTMLLITVPMGVLQVAIGYLIVEILGCFSLFCVSHYYYGYHLLDRLLDTWRPILFSVTLYLVMSLDCLDLDSHIIEIVVKVILGLFIYVLLCIIFRDPNQNYILSLIKKHLLNHKRV